MYQGGCLCGAVRFEVHGEISSIIYCHCSQCRKAQGGAFGVNGFVASDSFKLTAGADVIRSFESSAGKFRCFCANCGSPIMSRRDSDPARLRIRLGSLDGEVSERPRAHIFYDSRANWCEMTDDLPKYDSYEPGR
jgi:hypothetical protein